MTHPIQALRDVHRSRNDRGAVAVFVALTMVIVLAAAAFSIDTTTLAMRRATLQDTLDSAAQIGASLLPDNPEEALASAARYLTKTDPTITPDIRLWCVVSGIDAEVITTQIPGECDPGTGPYTANVNGVRCGPNMCAIPCPSSGVCNALSVQASATVEFYFAPAIGVSNHSTGPLTAASCIGACGEESATTSGTVFIKLPT